MSFGKNKSKSSSTATLDKGIVSTLQNNIGAMQQKVAEGPAAYVGERVAGFTPDQTAAQGLLKDIAAQVPTGIKDAASAGKGLAQFIPSTVAGTGYTAANANAAQVDRGAVRDVAAGQVKDADLSAYMNPYEDEVVNRGLADLERQRQIQSVSDSQAAKARNAWGGDRHGVVDSLTNEASLRASGGLAAQLRLAGYDRATGLAGQDIDRRYSADATNQGVDLNVANTNAGLSQQAALANQGATNAASQFTAGQGLTAGLANQQAELAGAGVRQAGAGLSADLVGAELDDSVRRAGLVAAVGDAQQANAQAGNDAAYQDFLRQQEEYLAMLGLQNQAVGLLGNPVLNNSSSKSFSLSGSILPPS